MSLFVSNQSGVDIRLFVNNKEHYIQNGKSNIRIENGEGKQIITVKNAVSPLLPKYKSVFITELLGFLALLFVKPWFYIVNVSSTYIFSCEKDSDIILQIERVSNQKNAEVIYDVVRIISPQLSMAKVWYCAENKAEVSDIYRRANKNAHFWLYFTLVSLFSLIGIAEFLMFSLLFKEVLIFKSLSFVLPLLFVVAVSLLFILPLHFWFKYKNRKFYELLEHKGIISRI